MLEQLDHAKTAFFSNVSHEFRTPLTLMIGNLEDALAGKALPEDERVQLDVAHRNSLRLLKLVNSLLDFSRIEAGRAQATYQPTDIAALTAELASNFRSACDRAGLKLVVDCPPLSEPVYVDRACGKKSFSTFSPTLSNSPLREKSLFACVKSTARCSFRFRIQALAYRTRSCRVYSSVSTASQARRVARTKAAALDSHSSRNS